MFPYTQTQFWTLDYIEPTSDDVHQEEYYWLKDEVHDSNIVGLEVNDQGNLLAVWTESNIIYIYKRGAANTKHVPRRVPSLLNRVDQWLDVAIPDTLDDEEERHVRERRKRGLPLDWRLRMAITAKEGELGSVVCHFVHTQTQKYDLPTHIAYLCSQLVRFTFGMKQSLMIPGREILSVSAVLVTTRDGTIKSSYPDFSSSCGP